MGSGKETLAQNVAILANGLELGAQIVQDVAGGDDVGSNYNGKPVDRATVQSWIADEFTSSLRPHLGG